MPKLVVILAVMFLQMPIYGQKGEPKVGQYDVANPSVNYLSRLFSPENLPNIGLLGAGIIGIFVATRTLNAIKEQSKIANATLVTQFRPKVIVRSMRLDPPSFIYFDRRGDGIWKIELQLMNIGGTVATIQKGLAFFQEYVDGHPRKELAPFLILEEKFSLRPGERRSLDYALSPEAFRDYMQVLETSTTLKDKQPCWPICHGAITYRDENGFDRETGFGREWNVKEERFDPLDDPKFEYQD
jgi:hypothetical protein